MGGASLRPRACAITAMRNLPSGQGSLPPPTQPTPVVNALAHPRLSLPTGTPT
jgi:hypothetical protein